jgi:hypothetical protein
MDDMEFCLRCRELGYRNVLLTRLPAMHLESASRGPYKHLRRAYNRSIFFARWTGRFQPDLCDYLSASAKRELRKNNARSYPAPVINFSNTPNWLELVETLSTSGVNIGSIHNLSGWMGESGSIDLFRTVPLAFNRLPSSILFVVDHFNQLLKNQFWFSRRLNSDLVVDRHANVLTGERFGFGDEVI